MKRLLILLAIIGACAPKGARVSIPSRDGLDGVMRLIGRSSFAHACPVDGLVLSAAHVVQYRNHLSPPLPWPHYYAWSDGHDASGYVQSFGLLPRDLGVFMLSTGAPHFYRHATIEPQSGDVLRWMEFDLSNREKAFEPREVCAKVQRLISGHIVMTDPPARGASGSCVLNDADEVVAIVIWAIPVDGGDAVGMVVSVAGPWWPGD